MEQLWFGTIHFKKENIRKNLDEFRKMVPLTTYEDYADVLLTEATGYASGKSCYMDTDNLGGWKASDQGGTVYQKYAGYVSK